MHNSSNYSMIALISNTTHHALAALNRAREPICLLGTLYTLFRNGNHDFFGAGIGIIRNNSLLQGFEVYTQISKTVNHSSSYVLNTTHAA